MDVRLIQSGATKACSVALAVTLGTMGIPSVALADVIRASEQGSQSSQALVPRGIFFDGGCLSYEVQDDNTVAVIGFAEDVEAPDDLIVPASVDFGGTSYEVTEIADAAALSAESSITFPATITRIGSDAFTGWGYDMYFLGIAPTFYESGYDFSWCFDSEGQTPEYVYVLTENMDVQNENDDSWDMIWYSGPEAKAFAAPTKVQLSKSELSLSAGEQETLTATNVMDADDLDKSCEAHKAITWSSSDPSVATVDQTGNVTVAEDAQKGATAVITATNAIGFSASCQLAVDTAQGPVQKTDLNDCVFETPNKFSPIPDQKLPMTADPAVKIFPDWTSKTPLVEGVDYTLSYENEAGDAFATCADITEAGSYYLVVTGIGAYEGTAKFDFKAIPSSLSYGAWNYTLDEAGNAIITALTQETDETTDLSVPASIEGHAVTSISSGAFTGRIGVLRIPATVNKLASGAFDGLRCNYVLFSGDCPAGPEDAVKNCTPGLYYAQGAAGWSDEDASAWASAYSPEAYDATWTYLYGYDKVSKKATWSIGGYNGAGGEVTVPSTVFTGDQVVALLSGAIADASAITKLTIPATIAVISDGAVHGLSDDATVDFKGMPPVGASYSGEFLDAAGATTKAQLTYLPEYAQEWQASAWAASGKYNIGAYDIYTCNPTDYTYAVDENGELTILGYSGDATIIRLPSRLDDVTVTVYQGIDAETGDPVYAEKKVSGNVTAVGELAFGTTKENDGVAISKIAIPASIKKLGNKAFLQCQLTSIEFEGEGLESIGDQCFWMSDLPTITIPASVTHIGEGAFFDDNMASFSVAEGSKSFAAVDGVLFSKDLSELVSYPFSSPAKSYEVPATVKKLANYAFATRPNSVKPNLEQLTLNDGLQEIGDCAFQNLKWVESIDIPDTVTTMGTAVFNSADEIKRVKLPANLETLPNSTFQFCYNLSEVVFPKNLKKIDEDAFLECDALTSLNLPEGVESIGAGAFSGCGGLTSVEFPSTLKVIDDHAFSTTNITEFDGSKTNIEFLGVGAFADTKVVSVTLPSTLKSMSNSVFSSCYELENVTIPSDMPLTLLPDRTFFGDENIQMVTIPAQIDEIGERAFFGCTGLEQVVILGQGNINLGSDVFSMIDPENTLETVFMDQLTVFGYGETNLPSYVPEGQFESISINFVNDLPREVKTRTGIAVQLDGTATCSSKLSYQWFNGADPIEGATSPVLTFAPDKAGSYVLTLQVSNAFDPENPASVIVRVDAVDATVATLAGDEAFQTSVAISQEAFSNESADCVVLVRDDDFADAMSATGLAGALNAPILLVNRDSGLSDEVKAEIARLGAKQAIIVGGKAAIPADLEGQLSDINVTTQGRVFGTEAADTSVACAKKIAEVTGSQPAYAVVAMSDNFQDALSMSSFAYAHKAPIILETVGDDAAERSLPVGGLSVLNGASEQVFVAGGVKAISDESISGVNPDKVKRLSGNDGYDTSNQIANYLVANGLLSAETVVVANGGEGAKGLDALSGAVIAGKNGGALILTNGNERDDLGAYNDVTVQGNDSEGTQAFLSAHAASVMKVYALGGEVVMPKSMIDLVTSVVNKG